MFNLIGIAQAITEEEHLAHHAQDKIADATNNMTSMMGGNMMGYMWGLGSGWGWLTMIFMWLFWVLILVALILFIVWLLKQIQK